MVIKPLEEDSTPGTAKPFQVSLVEPVAYQFQLSPPFAFTSFQSELASSTRVVLSEDLAHSRSTMVLSMFMVYEALRLDP